MYKDEITGTWNLDYAQLLLTFLQSFRENGARASCNMPPEESFNLFNFM